MKARPTHSVSLSNRFAIFFIFITFSLLTSHPFTLKVELHLNGLVAALGGGKIALLLETEQPELYALVATLEPEEYGELFVFKTDCGTALAIHEWLLAHLPESTSRDEALQAAETRMRVRMEELDPGSGFLYRIVSWTASDHDVVWPDAWPADWADRFRTAENWALFFPSERYTPNAEKPAYLLFVP